MEDRISRARKRARLKLFMMVVLAGVNDLQRRSCQVYLNRRQDMLRRSLVVWKWCPIAQIMRTYTSAYPRKDFWLKFNRLCYPLRGMPAGNFRSVLLFEEEQIQARLRP